MKHATERRCVAAPAPCRSVRVGQAGTWLQADKIDDRTVDALRFDARGAEVDQINSVFIDAFHFAHSVMCRANSRPSKCPLTAGL